MEIKAQRRLFVASISILLSFIALRLTANVVTVLAASYGKFPLMKLAVFVGGDVNNKEGGVLYDAILRRNYDAALFLIKAGSDVNQKPIIEGTEAGDVPLFVAIRTGDYRITRLLVTNGADVNARDAEGNTPLIRASSYGELAICKILIAHGSSLKSVNNCGDNALSAARKEQKQDVTSFLAPLYRPRIIAR